ncbi:hypothetical protein FR483_n534R [Paramecium bursaria Chlorella virus FR483]|uniref:Uncharacterized protein n534R n=1 Tax=Paramecium bursaria Chlorella virus FR483 TaxID=399781 RepID=A7J7N8_PBCVF|nr:hypothetical protein FR483_n534R [Paramecium bursaria Chlorella virus FR483]ABT15819.1 hypothetical protein FR483_n534R [Paramecium bursaria Chlorella virus FR483]
MTVLSGTCNVMLMLLICVPMLFMISTSLVVIDDTFPDVLIFLISSSHTKFLDSDFIVWPQEVFLCREAFPGCIVSKPQPHK